VVMNRNNGVAVAGMLYLQSANPQVGLDEWHRAIDELDIALADAGAARAAIDAATLKLERIEAREMLTIEGGNAETRKARLTLALADHPEYQQQVEALRMARERQFDADRRATVQRERCRLLRATFGLAEQRNV
jgi:hypothetical protein